MSPKDQIETEPLRLAVCEQAGCPRKGWHDCVIGDHIRFHTDGLESYCFAASQPLGYDLMLVAAAVEVCDKSRRRPRHGWRRSFSIDIPVHDPVQWRDPAVADRLRDALELLTGDEWDLHFRSRSTPVPAPAAPMLPLPMQVAAVMPYSDGLDSRAVATLLERSLDGQLIRVRLGPVNDSDPTTRRQFAKVPYSVKPIGKAAESSGRSRAFKFTALAGIAARLSGASRIVMSESMQGALGPALVPVAHAYEDYRNHPLFTDRMAAFLCVLFGQSFHFDYPRLWSTKAETLIAAIAADATAALKLTGTRSCWQDSRQVAFDGRRRQCGICAACLLRRMSLHAAGLEDPPGTYIWEDLSAPTFAAAVLTGFNPKKVTRAQRAYAIAGALHMDHLAELHRTPANVEEITHAAYRLARPPRLSETEIALKITDGLERHRAEWKAFLAAVGPESFLHAWTKGDQP
ncbi:7-cyano-7-deazaguanine synthase [Hyphomicrobium sp.]|uniref:7-cyano-7-deazaguanine synthase n=1 Tax=Hyphomicrobium sp. TaxID=82 RepID=UPI001D36DF89|nr:7-cyano-7-deazaguanine synthase [Hyphomicrobium sp.]MBY0562429.1 7-cyano-7-deazaguanine synthase [Hyphomicrobium sp.]